MSYFDVYCKLNVPSMVIVISFMILCVADVMVMMVEKNSSSLKKILVLSLLIEYVFIVICSTVIYRKTEIEYRYSLIPFYSYPAYFNGKKDMIAEVLLNIALFIPVGLLSSFLLKGRQLMKVLAIGFALSLCIELTQLLFKKGMFEVDDLIHNTLGCYLGWMMMKGMRRLRHE